MFAILTNELLELANTVCKQKAESQTIECKAAHVDCPKRLYDTLSSFSNQDNGGVLLFGIYIPETKRAEKAAEESFWQNCLGGVRFLWEHKALLHLTLFLAAVNFLAKMGNDGMIAPFVLSRTGSDQTALGMVQTAVALGLLAGSLIVTSAKPAKDKAKLGFAFKA